MIQSGGFLADITGLNYFVNFPFKALESYSKEIKNTGTKKLSNDILVDAGLNKFDKKEFHWLRVQE